MNNSEVKINPVLAQLEMYGDKSLATFLVQAIWRVAELRSLALAYNPPKLDWQKTGIRTYIDRYVLPAVVRVLEDEVAGEATAFFIKPRFLVTAYHVASNRKRLSFATKIGDRSVVQQASVIAIHPLAECALLHLDEGEESSTCWLELSNSGFLDFCSPVLSIGHPDGIPVASVSAGISLGVLQLPPMLMTTLKPGEQIWVPKNRELLRPVSLFAEIESEGGASGSPIIDVTGKVVSLLSCGFVVVSDDTIGGPTSLDLKTLLKSCR